MCLLIVTVLFLFFPILFSWVLLYFIFPFSLGSFFCLFVYVYFPSKLKSAFSIHQSLQFILLPFSKTTKVLYFNSDFLLSPQVLLWQTVVFTHICHTFKCFLFFIPACLSVLPSGITLLPEIAPAAFPSVHICFLKNSFLFA